MNTHIFKITKQDIFLSLQANNKEEAISQIADFFVQNGNVLAPYKQDMLEREKVVSTYLINGIAIPHGVHASTSNIVYSGIVIAQYPNGILWNANNDIAYLLCGIASNNEMHIPFLEHLSNIILDTSLMEKIRTTQNIDEIINAFSFDTH